MTLLPPNATALERAVEAASARLGDVPTPLRDLWNPATCPLPLLPYLAWALSIDAWSSDWSEAVKRRRVAAAIQIQRTKGTAASVRSVVESFGGAVAMREWWQTTPRGQPHSFDLVLSLDRGMAAEQTAAFADAVIAEVHRAKPVRSVFTFSQALAGRADLALVAAPRPAVFTRLALAA